MPLLAAVGLVTMYSAGYDHGTRFVDHGRNMLLALAVLFVVAQVPPQQLEQLAVPLYTVGLALLVATALFGITRKGATRWLALGPLVIQPSEMLKIAMPLMLAWWFQKREGQLHVCDFVVAAAAAAAAGGAGRQAARPRHRAADPGRRPVRDLLRRPVAGSWCCRCWRWARWASSRWCSRPTPSASPAWTGRAARVPADSACAPCSTRPRTRWARASTSSRA